MQFFRNYKDEHSLSEFYYPEDLETFDVETETASKTKSSIYTPDVLWASVSSDYKHLTMNHTINLFIMIPSLKRGFAVHNPYVQNMP